MNLNNGLNLHISTAVIPCSLLSYFRFSFGFLSLFILCTAHHILEIYSHFLLISRADLSNPRWYYFFLHLFINRIYLFMWFKLSCYNKEVSKNAVTKGRWKFEEWFWSPTHDFSFCVYFLEIRKREKKGKRKWEAGSFLLEDVITKRTYHLCSYAKTDCKGTWGM